MQHIVVTYKWWIYRYSISNKTGRQYCYSNYWCRAGSFRCCCKPGWKLCVCLWIAIGSSAIIMFLLSYMSIIPSLVDNNMCLPFSIMGAATRSLASYMPHMLFIIINLSLTMIIVGSSVAIGFFVGKSSKQFDTGLGNSKNC